MDSFSDWADTLGKYGLSVRILRGFTTGSAGLFGNTGVFTITGSLHPLLHCVHETASSVVLLISHSPIHFLIIKRLFFNKCAELSHPPLILRRRQRKAGVKDQFSFVLWIQSKSRIRLLDAPNQVEFYIRTVVGASDRWYHMAFDFNSRRIDNDDGGPYENSR